MDIEKYDAKFGSLILLTVVLLIIIPSSAGYIDCRISCRRCHENTEHPAVLEVYCAMCEECKQRRRERMLGKTKGKIKPAADTQAVRMKVGVEGSTLSGALILRPQESLQYQQEDESQLQYQGQPQQQYQPQRQFGQQPVYRQQPPLPPQEPPPPQQPQPVYNPQKALRGWGWGYPSVCPTPPICSDTEEDLPPQTPMPLTEPETTSTTTSTTSTTTTTTTSTRAPCPPITECRKKKPTHPPYPPPPCMNPCMFPMPMCPCPQWPQPQPPPPPPPITNMSPHAHTETNDLMLLTDHTEPVNEDYHYVYIGLPKKFT